MARGIEHAAMGVVDLAQRTPGSGRFGHRCEGFRCDGEHLFLVGAGPADDGRAHQAGSVAVKARRKLDGHLIDIADPVSPADAAPVECTRARIDQRPGRRHISSAFEDDGKSRRRDRRIEDAGLRGFQHGQEGVVCKPRRLTHIGDFRPRLHGPQSTDEVGGILELAPAGHGPADLFIRRPRQAVGFKLDPHGLTLEPLFLHDGTQFQGGVCVFRVVPDSDIGDKGGLPGLLQVRAPGEKDDRLVGGAEERCLKEEIAGRIVAGEVVVAFLREDQQGAQSPVPEQAARSRDPLLEFRAVEMHSCHGNDPP